MSALSLLGCALTLVFAAGAWAAPTGSGCQLSANVDFGHTPLTPGSTSPIGFKLSGTLSNCQTNISGAPAAGTIEIGQTYTDAATGKKYREPAGSGSSACANVAPGSWGGPAIVRWTGGGVTLVPLTFSNVGPLTDAIGAAPQATLQLQPVDPLDDPLVLRTTVFAGYSTYGALIMNFAPTDCVGSGVSSATLTGVFGPVAFS